MGRGRFRFGRPLARWATCLILGLCLGEPSGFCQSSGQPSPSVPLLYVGGGYSQESQFARLDFAQMSLDAQAKKDRERQQNLQHNKDLVSAGSASALDLVAPAKAVNEYNRASSLLRTQHSGEAIEHLQKAIAIYPRFVSAHNGLGLAYLDIDDVEHAQNEFEIAAALDEHFPGSFLNLGRLALSRNDYASAEAHLQKADSARPRDPEILTPLAYAQHGSHEYREAIATAALVHELPHPGTGRVHYVAASAAISLNDFDTARKQLALFLQEDPNNPLAAMARHDLEVLARPRTPTGQNSASPTGPAPQLASLANSEHLQSQLLELADEGSATTCAGCADATAVADASGPAMPSMAPSGLIGFRDDGWTLRKAVDEVAVFFTVTRHGRMVTDLSAADIQVRDDQKPPEKVLQFTAQSRLPLRLGLLIDTSGSVQSRFSFEKRAAGEFLEKVLNTTTDLAFVAGFADAPSVMQDFTADQAALAGAVNQLANGGGTALFDAVSFSCWKLGAYPEVQRVARVLVVVSDGEDNAGHTSLNQAIRDAEATGVTIYSISTKQGEGGKTDADKVLQALAERSGGEALFPGDMTAMGNSFSKLGEMIRSRYLIAYKPADFMANGKYRAISIKAEKNGEPLQVHARKGYHARSEQNLP